MFDTPPPNLPVPGSSNRPVVGGGSTPPPVVPPTLPVMPRSSAVEPEDIFAGTEPSVTPPQRPATPPPLNESPFKPVTFRPNLPVQPHGEMPIQPPTDYLAKRQFFPWRKLLIALATVVVIGGGGYTLYTYRESIFGGLRQGDANEPTDLVDDINNEPSNPYDLNTVIDTPLPGGPLDGDALAPTDDNDADGLGNEQETALGTDSNNSDTDGDKLYDGEEVNTFKTDPLKIDTDGDGFNDGDEVMNNYNPNGSGRLYSVPPLN
jgi:hypothetical protein